MLQGTVIAYNEYDGTGNGHRSTYQKSGPDMGNFITSLFEKIRSWVAPRDRGGDRERVARLFRFKYACFKDLLASNTELLNIITDLEQKLRGLEVFGMSYIRSQATRAVFHTLKMVKSLDDLSGHRYPLLFAKVEEINVAIREELGSRKELPITDYILPYFRITKEMVDWVGGKNANLGELLNRSKVPIPHGFAITTKGYEFFLEYNDLIDEINRVRMDLDPNDPQAVNDVSQEIQRLIISAQVPAELEAAIRDAYDEMAQTIAEKSGRPGARPHVAIRSSAIGEDSELSYAGQYLSVLNVPPDRIIETYKLVLASLYTPRAIAYRLNKGMRDEDIAMSVACIEMVQSETSGVMYSRHPFNPLENNILINAVWGLGPYAVEGIITPDSYVVSREEPPQLLSTTCSHKAVKLVSNPSGGLRELAVEEDKQDSPCLTKAQIEALARFALQLELHYKYPQDIEWTLDRHGRLLILQTRPLHIEDFQQDGMKVFPRVEGYPLLTEGGSIAFPGVGCGTAVHVVSDEDLTNFPDGGILVAKHSDPQYVIVMQKAGAIVTDAGSVTGHMASVAREFGVPTILGVSDATSRIRPGTEITVDAYSGRVYEGRVPELTALQKHRETAMKDTPVYQTLRKLADRIVPLNLVNPRAKNFNPENCQTLHDIMRLVHELSYTEMFQISDAVTDTGGAGALKLAAPIPLDLHIIDLGGGLAGVSDHARRALVDQIASIPFAALMKGMLNEKLRDQGPRPIDFGGFFSVMREQMLAPNNMAERFGDRSYAIISDKYLNFSSRIGYHYSVLDAYCGDTINKNYITFSFKGGAADETRRNRRARAISEIFKGLDFQVEVQEDRVDARFYKYERPIIEAKLDIIGRMLQFTRQMDMLMNSEQSVRIVAESFLAENYDLDSTLFADPAS